MRAAADAAYIVLLPSFVLAGGEFGLYLYSQPARRLDPAPVAP
eukprot:COSAG05_NODE_12833_length_452_cov_1.045326_1_plen_42_part_10